MEEILLTSKNCTILTDDSSCLSKPELEKFHVKTVPINATADKIITPLKASLKEKEFVLFVGPAQSLSSNIYKELETAISRIDKKDKRLNANERVTVFNTSCFSGGLGFYITLLAEYINSGERKLREVIAYNQFLANHIAHFFVEPSDKRWNQLIYVPRTGEINYAGGKYRGNKGIFNYIAGNFRDYAYHPGETVWICHPGPSSFEHAKNLARQIKRCCPDSNIDLSHSLAKNTLRGASDDVIACFFLSIDVRPDEPMDDMGLYAEIAEKRRISKEHITEISRFAQAFRFNPNPNF